MNYHQRKYLSSFVLASTAFGALFLCNPSPGLAVAFLNGDLASFAVLGSSTVTNTLTDTTDLTGDVGVSEGSAITGQATLNVNGVNALSNPGDVHLNDAIAISGQSDLTTARGTLDSLGPGLTQPVDLAGLTLGPGVYTVPAGDSNLTGTLTLDGQGDSNAVFVIQIGSTLTTATIAVVDLIGGAKPGNVYWQVGSSATLGLGTAFAGNIVALESITLTTGASLAGRALARTGAVTMDTNAIVGGTSVPVREISWGMFKAFYR